MSWSDDACPQCVLCYNNSDSNVLLLTRIILVMAQSTFYRLQATVYTPGLVCAHRMLLLPLGSQITQDLGGQVFFLVVD